jgi:hypothetical protein
VIVGLAAQCCRVPVNSHGSPAQMRQVVVLALLQAVAFAAWSQEIPEAVRQKVEIEVIERAQMGTPQDAGVTLEASDVTQRAAMLREAKGLRMNDAEVEALYRREIARIREEVFPGGKLGDITVKYFSPFVPSLTVYLSGMDSLVRLAEHPRVKYVHDNYRKYYPQGGSASDGVAHGGRQ